MANTSSRTLRLLSLLQAHRHWRGSDLAERLSVSERTLRRDVDRLRELGYDVDATPGVDGGYQLRAGTALPPLVVDDEEAVALAVGMQAATDGAIPGIEEASVRALGKVVQVMPPRLRRRVDALRAMTVPATWGSSGGGPVVNTEALVAVAQACRDSERLRFDYTARAGEVTSRHVEPHRLVRLGRRWYLAAWDLDRTDWRSFRLDRLREPRSTGARFAPRTPPGGDAAEYVKSSIVGLRDPHQVVVDVRAPAEAVRARIGRWATVTETGPERCRVEMAADQLEWPAMALGSLGAEFTVVEPAEFHAYLRDWSQRFARATA
ncbi:YafY family protein [Sporichthya sp.]|uniref:helix-turn-helix transcriptional regulator n=1 Tax=Sporichthya sp. TaxID=65475 RepID=UPI00180C9231|nr:YafY family protein [Sporichthya sp.]MBA3744968.1 YafY family transcriptional regulator [Sporichthya sp.]